MWPELQGFIMTVVLTVIGAAVPVITMKVLQLLEVRIKSIRLNFTPEQNAIIDEGIQLAIHAAEQNGLVGKIENVGRTKLNNAIETAQVYLNARGLNKISVAEIEARIEQGILLGWKQPESTTP